MADESYSCVTVVLDPFSAAKSRIRRTGVFPSDLLWYDHWREILTIAPRFVEIISCNDYGEPHYVVPLSWPHTDDGASKWVVDM